MKKKLGRGRREKQIDKVQFETLCGIQCTLEEICFFFSTTDKTVNIWCRDTYGMTFSEIFKEKKGLGKISLRRKQWRLANNSTAMAIFLGKNYLGQTDEKNRPDQQQTCVQIVDDVLKE